MAESRVRPWRVAFVVKDADNTWRDTNPETDEEKALHERLTNDIVWEVLQAKKPTSSWHTKHIGFGIKPENIELALKADKKDTWLVDGMQLPIYIELVDLSRRGARGEIVWYEVSDRQDLKLMGLPDGSDEMESTTDDSVQTGDDSLWSGPSASDGSRT